MTAVISESRPSAGTNLFSGSGLIRARNPPLPRNPPFLRKSEILRSGRFGPKWSLGAGRLRQPEKNHFLRVISKRKSGTSCSKSQNFRACGAKIPLLKGDFKGKIEYSVLKSPKIFAPAGQKQHHLRGNIVVGAKIGLNAP